MGTQQKNKMQKYKIEVSFETTVYNWTVVEVEAKTKEEAFDVAKEYVFENPDAVDWELEDVSDNLFLEAKLFNT